MEIYKRWPIIIAEIYIVVLVLYFIYLILIPVQENEKYLRMIHSKYNATINEYFKNRISRNNNYEEIEFKEGIKTLNKLDALKYDLILRWNNVLQDNIRFSDSKRIEENLKNTLFVIGNRVILNIIDIVIYGLILWFSFHTYGMVRRYIREKKGILPIKEHRLEAGLGIQYAIILIMPLILITPIHHKLYDTPLFITILCLMIFSSRMLITQNKSIDDIKFLKV